VSTAPVKTIPQPLTGSEIKRGIAVRMTMELPDESREDARENITAALGKVCTLTPNSAYSKFRAEWKLQWWIHEDKVRFRWEIRGTLEDYGRETPFSFMSGWVDVTEDHVEVVGEIPFTPPDKFRRETDQPIPKPTELKPPEPEKSTFSKSMRGGGNRRQV
jgi:hypothetical protein